MLGHTAVHAALTLLSFAAASLAPAGAAELWPGARYDAAIPTFAQVLGHEPGERIVAHAEMRRYFDALADAAPDRLKLVSYGRTWEGRELFYAILGARENIARLEQLRAGSAELRDPALAPARAEVLIGQLPATVWLAYGVHGNEISSVDAAMFTAYHLLAAQGDEVAARITREVLLFLVPSQNPDGRDRFVFHNRANEGIVPDPTRAAAERDEPWPGGRTNHYHFDLNRDWFILSQPETQGHVRALREWLPLVFVDLHEMGSDSTYYFAPEAIPYNPHLAADQRRSLERVGRNNAKRVDRFGFDYFTREVYDAFYPGYGASWPSYYGSVAMTYEMASARGLVVRRQDGTLLHFRDGVLRHFVTSISTAEAAADHRRALLEEFLRYQRSAADEGRTEEVKEIVLQPANDHAAADQLAGLLVAQGALVFRATAPWKSACGSFAEGSYVVPLAQAAKRLVRTLLDPDVPMEPEFIVEQERRRRKRLPDEIYDVTGWSLPLMFNVPAVRCTSASPRGAGFVAASADLVRPGTLDRSGASVGYLVPWGSTAAARLLALALRDGLVALSPERPFTLGGRDYAAGSLVFNVDDNPTDLAERLAHLASRTGASVYATDTSWVERGVNFGSRTSVRLTAPRVVLAWDAPAGAYSAGNTRFVLERLLEYPVSVVRTRSLAGALESFDVLILPDTGPGYGAALGAADREPIERWVESGGTANALGDATAFLAEDAGLLSTRRELLAGAPAKPASGDDGADAGKLLRTEADYHDAIRAPGARPDAVAGVLLRARTDPDHWLAAGLPAELAVLFSGRSIFTPLTLDRGTNVLVFPGADSLLASGYLWQENRDQLAWKPFVMVETRGRGNVIAFTADPNLRAYQEGTRVLFANAVFRSAADR